MVMKERKEGRKERKRIIGRNKYFHEDLRWVRHENIKIWKYETQIITEEENRNENKNVRTF